MPARPRPDARNGRCRWGQGGDPEKRALLNRPQKWMTHPGAFKLDNLQSTKPIFSKYISTLLTGHMQHFIIYRVNALSPESRCSLHQYVSALSRPPRTARKPWSIPHYPGPSYSTCKKTVDSRSDLLLQCLLLLLLSIGNRESTVFLHYGATCVYLATLGRITTQTDIICHHSRC